MIDLMWLFLRICLSLIRLTRMPRDLSIAKGRWMSLDEALLLPQ